VQWFRFRDFLAVRHHGGEELSRFDSQQLQDARANLFVFYLFGILGTGSTLLQLYNIAILNAFWPFFTGIVVHLLADMSQFARIILSPPES
jgi:hypothetical protein